jgi:acyl-CoA-binding protein
MVNTIYQKSINKTLISRNCFYALQKRLLLGDNHPERPGFAIDILKDF